MEIIRPRTDEQKQVECGRCGAVIGYYETEVRYWIVPPKQGHLRLIKGIGFSHIVCPSCGSIIRINDERKNNNESD